MSSAKTVAITVSSFAEADPAPMQALTDAGFEVIQNPYGRRMTEDEAIKALVGVDGIVAGLEPLSSRVLESAPHLRCISRVGIGVDNVDLDTAKRLGIQVVNTPDGPTEAVAEATLTNLLALLRHTVQVNRDLHEGTWKKRMGRSLRGLKVLLIGYGRIGQKVADFLSPFGVEILVFDPYATAETLKGRKQLQLEDGLAIADVVSLHANSKEVILDTKAFDLMKPGTIVLNPSRGCLIDENALVEALKSGQVTSAWLDTFVSEPYEGPLTAFDSVILTPHAATSTSQCRLSMESQAAANLIKALNNEQ